MCLPAKPTAPPPPPPAIPVEQLVAKRADSIKPAKAKKKKKRAGVNKFNLQAPVVGGVTPSSVSQTLGLTKRKA
jgi:hypothetical protein